MPSIELSQVYKDSSLIDRGPSRVQVVTVVANRERRVRQFDDCELRSRFESRAWTDKAFGGKPAIR